MKLRDLLLLASAALLAPCGWAADDFTDAAQQAYGPYRAALFRTNGKAQAEAEQAMANARQRWQAIVDRFANKPPPPYDRDASFAATLAQVAAVYARADGEVKAQQLPQAHETLEQVRELLSELRRRNGVIVYSDHMNAYHAEMEQLLATGPKLLAAPQGQLQLLPLVGTLEYLARKLRSEAPAELTRDPDFPPLLQAVDGSLVALKSAVQSGDIAAAQRAIGQLKGPYSRLFLKFG